MGCNMQREEDKSNPASAERSSRSPTQTSSIRIGHHIPLSEEQRILSFLKLLFLLMLVVAVLLTAVAWAAWVRTSLYQLLVLGCFAPVAVIAAGISFVGVTRAQAELGDRAALLSRVKGTVGEDIAQFGLYTCMCALAGLLLLGTGCLLYQDQMELLTSADAADAAVWAERHPEVTPESMRSQLRMYLLAAGSLCLVYCLLGLIAFAKQVTLSVDNESQHVLVQVLSFIQLCLGLLLLFSVGFSHKAKAEVSVDSVSDSLLLLLAIAGVSAVVTALLGFRAANKELIFDIGVFMFLTFCVLCFTAYLVATQFKSQRLDATEQRDSCLDSLALINEDYLGMLGCAKKYLAVSKTDQLQCLKPQIRTVWERQDLYGCLNVDCCGYFLSAAKSVESYTMIMLMGCGVVELLAIVASGFLISKISAKGTSIFHEADGRVFFLMLLFGIVGGGLIFASTVFTPYAKPMTNSPVVVTAAGQVDDALLGAELCFAAPQLHLPQSLANCSTCSSLSFLTSITAKSGHLRQSQPANVTVVRDSSTELQFESDSPDTVSQEVRQTWYCPECPEVNGEIHVSIVKNSVGKRVLRGLQGEIRSDLM